MHRTNTIGIDLGGTNMSAAVIDSAGHILRSASGPRPATHAAMRTEPINLARSLFDDSIAGIGVGAAGLVDHLSGTLVWGPNVVGGQVEFRAIFEDEFGVPTVVDNDANVAAFAESHLGCGRGHRHVAMITLGTGIGGGWIVDGQIYRGAGFAGEVGHMVIDVGGPRCTCGQSGCWEVFASGRRLDQMARDEAARNPRGGTAQRAEGVVPTGRHLTEAAIDGDADAGALIEEVAKWLGAGIANLIAAFDPEILVVGGGVCAAGEVLMRPVRRAVADVLEGAAHRSPTPILTAELGEYAGVVGAGLLARRETDSIDEAAVAHG